MERPESGSRRIGLEGKTREELEALWDKADDNPSNRADGYTQNQITQALEKLSQRELFSVVPASSDTAPAESSAEEDVLPGAGLPFKDERGRVQNFNVLRIRREGLAALRAKYPDMDPKNQPKK